MDIPLTFLPLQRMVIGQKGDTILDAALHNGIVLPHECGGNCACTTCHVIILEGMENLSPIEEAEADRLATAENRTPTSRLGCQALLQGGAVTVELPEGIGW